MLHRDIFCCKLEAALLQLTTAETFFNQPMIVAHNMSKTVFAYTSSAFVCLRGNCTGFKLDNIVNRIRHAFSFKMMYRNLGT